MWFKLTLLTLLLTVYCEENEEGGDPNQVKVEFIEDVSDQNYLEAITIQDRYYLDILNFDIQLKTTDFEKDPNKAFNCPKEIYQTFGLRGYFVPMEKSPEIGECPNMVNTCCTVGDFNKLRDLWDFKYQKYIEFHQYYFKFYITIFFEKADAIQRAAALVEARSKDPTCTSLAKKILDFNVTQEYLAQIKETIDRFFEFDMKIKKNFTCFLCDYESYKNWDIDNKIVVMNFRMCNEIVNNTLEYYELLNETIVKYINTVNFMTHCVNFDKSDKMGMLNLGLQNDFEFLKNDNSLYVEQCKLAKDRGKNLFSNCLNYCYKYNYWFTNQPMYRSIFQLANIFQHVKNKLFYKELEYDISEPKGIENLIPVFNANDPNLNVFENFDIVYADDQGTLPEVLLEMDMKKKH